MERLTLPAPARGLWAQTAAELHRLLKRLPTRAEGYGIGGGTVLAARWNHRKSTDIDLTVPEGCGLNIMTRKHSAVIRDRMKRLGSEEPLLTERHYRIEFRKGTIEIRTEGVRRRAVHRVDGQTSRRRRSVDHENADGNQYDSNESRERRNHAGRDGTERLLRRNRTGTGGRRQTNRRRNIESWRETGNAHEAGDARTSQV